MSTELTALAAAVIVGGFFAFSFVGDATKDFAARMFDVTRQSDFSAKFVKAP